METLLALGKCKCGKQLNAYQRSYPFETTSSYCADRKIWNFWKHDREQLLTFDRCRVVTEGNSADYEQK